MSSFFSRLTGKRSKLAVPPATDASMIAGPSAPPPAPSSIASRALAPSKTHSVSGVAPRLPNISAAKAMLKGTKFWRALCIPPEPSNAPAGSIVVATAKEGIDEDVVTSFSTHDRVDELRPIDLLESTPTYSLSITSATFSGRSYTFLIKCCAQNDGEGMVEINREIQAYRALSPLQGSVIPLVLGVFDTFAQRQVAFALPDKSFWITASPDMLPGLKRLVVDAWSQIHALGVLHGRPRLSRMLICADGRCLITGLEHARCGEIPGAEDMMSTRAAAMRLEMRAVKYLLNVDNARAVEHARYERARAARRQGKQRLVGEMADEQDSDDDVVMVDANGVDINTVLDTEDHTLNPPRQPNDWPRADDVPQRTLVPGQSLSDVRVGMTQLIDVLNAFQVDDDAASEANSNASDDIPPAATSSVPFPALEPSRARAPPIDPKTVLETARNNLLKRKRGMSDHVLHRQPTAANPRPLRRHNSVLISTAESCVIVHDPKPNGSPSASSPDTSSSAPRPPPPASFWGRPRRTPREIAEDIQARTRSTSTRDELLKLEKQRSKKKGKGKAGKNSKYFHNLLGEDPLNPPRKRARLSPLSLVDSGPGRTEADMEDASVPEASHEAPAPAASVAGASEDSAHPAEASAGTLAPDLAASSATAPTPAISPALAVATADFVSLEGSDFAGRPHDGPQGTYVPHPPTEWRMSVERYYSIRFNNRYKQALLGLGPKPVKTDGPHWAAYQLDIETYGAGKRKNTGGDEDRLPHNSHAYGLDVGTRATGAMKRRKLVADKRELPHGMLEGMHWEVLVRTARGEGTKIAPGADVVAPADGVREGPPVLSDTEYLARYAPPLITEASMPARSANDPTSPAEPKPQPRGILKKTAPVQTVSYEPRDWDRPVREEAIAAGGTVFADGFGPRLVLAGAQGVGIKYSVAPMLGVYGPRKKSPSEVEEFLYQGDLAFEAKRSAFKQAYKVLEEREEAAAVAAQASSSGGSIFGMVKNIVGW